MSYEVGEALGTPSEIVVSRVEASLPQLQL
jgi:hypothetical protein